MEADTPGAEAPGAEAPPNPGDNVDVVQDILESMLSKKNLVRDQFVAGNMNPQMYIPIRTLLDHERLKAITATEAAVAAAAARSTKLGIDEKRTMVRPMLKSRRNVVILRDLPEGTTEEDIRALVAGAPHAERLDSLKPEVNNTWFLKFKLDEGTQDVVLWLRSQRIKGAPVNAAIKSEHFLRSFFPLHLAGQGPPPEMMYGMPGPPDGMMPPMQGFDPGAVPGSWAAEIAPMDFPGGCMGPPPMMPQETMQLPGFWQPWGERYQPPPLIFESVVSLSQESAAAHMEQAAEVAGAIDLSMGEEEEYVRGDGKGKGKFKGDWKGEWKGEWKGDWKGDWKGEWKGGGKGKNYYGAESKGGYDAKGGYEAQDFGGGGGNAGGAPRRGGGDWYAASSGGKAGGWETAPRRKGGKGEKGEAPTEDQSGGKRGRSGQVRGRGGDGGVVAPASIPSAPANLPKGAAASGYKHDYRRYTREEFERIAQVLGEKELVRPEALDALSQDFPILREEPSIQLTSAPPAS
mmetsp:Transcript_40950/g.117633  ORF Transcript_40950/g.117633 Transcript_40950/m.117633 type:complete len:518 (-) Transcript_40950:75-1628(-)